MATRDEADAALLEAIVAVAAKSKGASQNQSSAAESFASAARQLAEARAWLNSQSQPH